MLGVGYLLSMNQRDESTMVEVDGSEGLWAKMLGHPLELEDGWGGGVGIAVGTHDAQHDPAGFAVEEIVGLRS